MNVIALAAAALSGAIVGFGIAQLSASAIGGGLLIFALMIGVAAVGEVLRGT